MIIERLDLHFYYRPLHMTELLEWDENYYGLGYRGLALVREQREISNKEYDNLVSDFSQNISWFDDRFRRTAQHRHYVIKITSQNRRTIYVDPDGTKHATYIALGE